MDSSIIKKRSIVSLALILLMISATYIMILSITQEETETGKVINTAGKQRMLSQRIVLLSKRYMQNNAPQTQKQLLAAIGTMKRDFQYLKEQSHGALQHIYEGKNYRLEYFLGEFLSKAEAVAQKHDRDALSYVESVGDYILKTSDTATSVYEQQYNDYIFDVRFKSTLIFIVSILLMVMIYYAILRPAIHTNETLIRDLMDSEEKISEITTNTDALIYIKDLEDRYLFVNNKFETLFAMKEKQLLGKTDEELFGYTPFILENKRVVRENRKITVEETTIINDERHFFLIEKFPVKTGEGEVYGHCGIATDITPMKNLQREVDEYVKIVDENVITSQTDLSGKITYVSKAFCEISSYEREELLGQYHRIIRHPDMPKSTFIELWKTVSQGGTWHGDIKNKTKKGGYYWVDTTISPNFDINGHIVGYTAIRQNITDKKRIEEISITDELTGLYNRRYFNQIIIQEINRCRRDNTPFTFILLDVDNFKKYNDTYGHQMGDDVLAAMGRVLRESTQRAGDYPFRLGGEEFGAIIDSESAQKSREFAEQLRERIQALGIKHEKNPPANTITASIGVRVISGNWSSHDENTIYKEVDTMLYKAKESGRNRVEMKDD